MGAAWGRQVLSVSPLGASSLDRADDSIFFYLMDPLGQFVDAFGKASTEEDVAQKTREAIAKWEAAGGNKAAGVPE